MNASKVSLAVVLGASAFLIGVLADGMLGASRTPTPPHDIPHHRGLPRGGPVPRRHKGRGPTDHREGPE